MDTWGPQQILDNMADMVADFSTAPSYADMPRKTLADKLACGPTSAHVIEEVHTPLNVAYTTFTTGSTAFQNIVGITHTELPEREAAGTKALELAGAVAGDALLVCYPPLVNVFSRGALDAANIEPLFLSHSSRDAFLVALCQQKPRLVVGESSFLRATLEDAKKLGIWDLIPRELVLICAGTPLDLELLPVAAELDSSVHDLYGCQEFGWLALDGVPVRTDTVLVPEPDKDGWATLVVGGMPTGDSFPIGQDGHVLNPQGSIATYARRRSDPELEVVVRACTCASAETLKRAARSILRIKGRVVHVAPDVVAGADANIIDLKAAWPDDQVVWTLENPAETVLFSRLLQAQEQFQSQSKSDPLWMKGGR